MNFIDAVKKCFRDYLTFQGRAPRSEYWWFALFLSAVMGALAFGEWATSGSAPGTPSFFHWIFLIFWAGTLLPSLAVGVRRLHDTDRTGWWMLLGVPLIMHDFVQLMGNPETSTDAEPVGGGFSILTILMIVCILLLLYFLIRKGTPGDNHFGPNPLGGGD